MKSEGGGAGGMTAREAQQLFDELNTAFFEGRLPRYQVRFGRRLFPGRSKCWVGRCDDDARVITLHERIDISSDPPVRQVLLHEMCHIRTPGGHGKRWQAKMQRLGTHAEAWVEQEIAQYVASLRDPRSYTAKIKDRFEELTFTDNLPSWPEALRYVANYFGVPQRQILRSAPRARTWWNHFVRDHKEQDLRDAEIQMNSAKSGGLQRT